MFTLTACGTKTPTTTESQTQQSTQQSTPTSVIGGLDQSVAFAPPSYRSTETASSDSAAKNSSSAGSSTFMYEGGSGPSETYHVQSSDGSDYAVTLNPVSSEATPQGTTTMTYDVAVQNVSSTSAGTAPIFHGVVPSYQNAYRASYLAGPVFHGAVPIFHGVVR